MESKVDVNLFLRIYDNCWKARFLDTAVQRLFPMEHPQPFFSGYGSELGPSVVSLLLRKEDYLIPQYRGFAAFLGKGVAPERIIGEILRKKIGTTKGLGDATSFRDPLLGIPGYTINLGAMFAVSAGLALAVKLKNEDRIVVYCFGDGEASRTTFGSALNLASLWKLPILFVCFNNGLSIETRLEDMSATKNIVERADGYNIKGAVVSEVEPVRLYERVKEAMSGVRKNRKPFLFEILGKRFVPHSYRYAQHDGSFQIPDVEDPVLIFEKVLIEKFNVGRDTVYDLKKRAVSFVEEAVEKAKTSNKPSLDDFLAIYQES